MSLHMSELQKGTMAYMERKSQYIRLPFVLDSLGHSDEKEYNSISYRNVQACDYFINEPNDSVEAPLG